MHCGRQKLFSTHRGTHVIPVLQDGKPLAGSDSLFASATIDKNDSKVYIKLVNTSAGMKPVNLKTEGVSFLKNGEMETLRATALYDYNSAANPKLIYPSSKTVTITGKKLKVILEPMSVNVIILDYKKPR